MNDSTAAVKRANATVKAKAKGTRRGWVNKLYCWFLTVLIEKIRKEKSLFMSKFSYFRLSGAVIQEFIMSVLVITVQNLETFISLRGLFFLAAAKVIISQFSLIRENLYKLILIWKFYTQGSIGCSVFEWNIFLWLQNKDNNFLRESHFPRTTRNIKGKLSRFLSSFLTSKEKK